MIHTITLGTYTRRISQGIYQIELDTAKETLNNLTLVTEETSPTYLTKSKQQTLYSVTSREEKADFPVMILKINF